MSAQDLFAAAVDHQKAGRLDQAAALYDEVLVREPTHGDALHYSALVALRRGDTGEAIARLRRATEAAPARAVAHNDLGAALRLAGKLPEAAAALERAVTVDPRYADAWGNLGMVRRALGDLHGARDALVQAVELKPDFAPTLNGLGVVLKALSRVDDAQRHFERAIALQPGHAEAQTNLGLLLLDKGDPVAAMVPLRRAMELAPKRGETWHNLGLAQRGCGELANAGESFQRAVAADPNLAVSWNALGAVRARQEDDNGACEAFARAAALDPNSGEILSNFGLALSKVGRNEEALSTLDRALALNPRHAEAVFNRGVARQRLGDFAGSSADWKATAEIEPAHRAARSNLIFSMQYDPVVDDAALYEAARAYDRLHGQPAERATAWLNSRDPERRLRIGYVSPDFRTHSVAHYIEPLLQAHDRARVELFAYAQVARPDETTRRLQDAVGPNWRFTVGVGTQAFARMVRDDAIDILVDLAGHSAGNRLAVFALRPAPVQATWLGYPGTTGLSAIDYRLTDAIADPEGADQHSSETLVRLPRGFHCWRPPADAPAIAPRDAARPPTFGSFNNVQKLSAATIALWAATLRRVPEARLLLKSSWLSRPRVLEDIRGAFAAHGIAADRIEAMSWMLQASSHLAAYRAIDVALDPVPYNGTTTTIEALWMGVPVVTMAGNRHAARVGASLMAHVGASELIALSEETYVDLAAGLIRDAAQLRHYRDTLRPQLARSPLLDAGGFARDLEAAYREMWRRWCDVGR